MTGWGRMEDGPGKRTADVLVYGSTPGGVAAAVEAARRGLRVVLACPKAHLGGMTASGICSTDAVRRHMFGGLVIEFIDRVRARYESELGRGHPDWALCDDGWRYEPSVAEAVFRDLVEGEENIEWLPGHVMVSAEVADRRVRAATLEDGRARRILVTARTFIDGTYEGDLAAAAGVPSRVGREGRDEFGESFAGIHYMNWNTGEEIRTSMSGEPSVAIQAYCARSILTDDPAHRLPIDKPDSYDEHLPDFLPILEDFRTGRVKDLQPLLFATELPRSKVEINGGIESMTSTNLPGVSWAYPEAGRATRKTLDRFHVEHVWGLLWFLQNDRHVPDDIGSLARAYGLHDREFADSGHWPWQIYVRQARRICGRALVTQHSFTVDPKTGRTPVVEDAVAWAEHSFDAHPCHDRRWAIGEFMEGVLWYRNRAAGPAQPGQVPYGALLPKDLDNLLVPVAMSSTHVAMTVLRMEPVWMTTGQVAGAAAAVAGSSHLDVADIDPRQVSQIHPGVRH